MKILIHLIQTPGFQFSDYAVDLLVYSAGLTLPKQTSGLCLWLLGGPAYRSVSVCLGALTTSLKYNL